MSTGTKTCLYQDQLDSLLILAGILPPKKLSVLRSLMKFLQHDTLKSTATREQIRSDTGLGLSTIYRYIREFIKIGLLKQWRGPFDKKQCYYKLNLPVTSSVLEFYAHSPRKAREQSSKQVLESLVHHEAGPERGGHVSHEEVEERSTALSSCQVDHPDETENLVAGEIPIVQDEGPGPACAGPTAAQLHPDISAVMDKLERTCQRTDAADFLTVMEFLEPQLSCDEKIVIDREKLLAFLLDRDANSPEEFCGLVGEYTSSAQENMPPRIDLPMSEPITRYVYRNLDHEYPLGVQWLWKGVPQWDSDWSPIPDLEIRRFLLQFMKENRLRNLDELAQRVAEEHNKESQRRRGAAEIRHEPESEPAPERELMPGELSCKAILRRFADYDPSWSEEVLVSEDEMDLYQNCQAKFDREHAHIADSKFKSIQRKAMVKVLMIAGRQNPELVGYQPERGDVCEPVCHLSS